MLIDSVDYGFDNLHRLHAQPTADLWTHLSFAQQSHRVDPQDNLQKFDNPLATWMQKSIIP